MALLYMDSFDHFFTADLQNKGWGAAVLNLGTLSVATAAARTGTQGLRSQFSGSVGTGAYLPRSVPATGAGFVLGVAFKPTLANTTGGNGTALLSIVESSTVQLALMLQPDLKLKVLRGGTAGTLIAGPTASAAITLNTWQYVEFAGVIDPSAGSLTVRINGAPVLTGSSLNTRASANSTWTGFRVGHEMDGANNASSGATWDFDDLYVLDGAGSAPWNTVLGDCRVDVRIPTAAGAQTQWTPSAGANYTCVDEMPPAAAPNGDTDYTAASSVGLIDTFVTQDAAVAGALIYGVQVNLTAKKSDTGLCALAAVVRQGGVTQVGPDLAPGTSYADLRQLWQTNPHTSAQWTESDFNADEFGYKRTA